MTMKKLRTLLMQVSKKLVRSSSDATRARGARLFVTIVRFDYFIITIILLQAAMGARKWASVIPVLASSPSFVISSA